MLWLVYFSRHDQNKLQQMIEYAIEIIQCLSFFFEITCLLSFYISISG